MEYKDYKEFARQRRIDVLKMTHRAQSSHIGSNFSCIDILTILYNIADLSLIKGTNNTKDIVLSKSWSAASVYACLVAKGLLPQEAITRYGEEGTPWTTILEPIQPYVKCGTGAMGYHLPFAVGFALAKKIQEEPGTVYCVISDGELNIGSTWESAAIAAHHRLDNLILIIDKNGFQAMGATKDILNMEPIHEKFRAFGWHVESFDGHDLQTMEARLKSSTTGNPRVFIAETIKGKGWARAENDNLWHYSHVNAEMLEEALKQLQ